MAKMLIKIIEKMPQNFKRFFENMLRQTILGQGSPLIPFWALVVHGIYLKPAGKGVFLASGWGEKILVSEGGWGVLREILYDEKYEKFFQVERGEVVLDIGAHVGVFTIKAGKVVGSDGLVVAVEPEPKNAAMLSQNVRNHGLKNVVIVMKAAGSRKRKAKLYLDPSSLGHSLMKVGPSFIEVEVDTLDNIASELKLKKVHFIKIDAEGAELEVLKGAERILGSPGVKLAISAYHELPGGSEFQKILSHLKSKNMKIWVENRSYIFAETR